MTYFKVWESFLSSYEHRTKDGSRGQNRGHKGKKE